MSMFEELFVGRCVDGPMAGETLTGMCEQLKIPVRPHFNADGIMEFDCVTYRWFDGLWYSTVH